MQPRNLIAQLAWISTIPSVRDQQDDRTAIQCAATPSLMELLDRSSNPGPPDQSGTACATAARAASGRRVRSCFVTLVRPRRKQERLDPMVPQHQRMSEVQKHARVALHRAAHVAEDHKRPRTQTPSSPRELHYFAARAQTVRNRAPQIDTWPPAAHPPPRPALAGIPLEAGPGPGPPLPVLLWSMPRSPCCRSRGRRSMSSGRSLAPAHLLPNHRRSRPARMRPAEGPLQFPRRATRGSLDDAAGVSCRRR